MSQAEITPEVRRFITEHIHSAEELDILLLLQGNPERQWAAHDVSQAVFTVPTSATLRLEGLTASGFLSSGGGADPRYQYAPRTPNLDAQVQALAAAYRANRVGVINLVFQRPPDPLKSFSDAFRLRRED